ncbi:sensor histidine kinase [Cohnella faecalis]|uniref:sensor histidine kinase n=1 Tax=Cohnella faecalis TaxID=2315694 RepID=UPI0011C22271|nr:sensor histidine kinase [Cohnella faecalis]
MIGHQHQTIGLIENNIKMMLDDAQDISSYIMNNETFQNLLNQPKPEEYNRAQQTMLSYLSNLKTAKSYISFIIVYGENGFVFRDFKDFYREVVPYQQLNESPTYIATAAKEGEANWMFSSDPLFPYLQQYNEVMVGRRITNIYDSEEKLGMLFMGIGREAFLASIQDVELSDSTQLLLVDDNYNLVASNQKNRDVDYYRESDLEFKKRLIHPGDNPVIRVNGQDFYISTAKVEPYEWMVVSLTPLKEIREQHQVLLKFTLIASVSVMLIVALLSIFLSRNVTSPIRKLLRSMNDFKRGDFNQKVAVESKDEVGLLTQKYNQMVAELNELIQKVYISQTNQKMIELKTLQAQIEPHFLYNTLDYIFLNSKINGDDETAEVVRSLSQLFRISLNRGSDYYSMENEINQIKAYVNIQQARFPSRFKVEYEIDPKVEPYLTSKLLLQPIVENAIIHSFDHKEKGEGVLRISGGLSEDGIVFVVEDNGKGMTEEQVAALLQVSPNGSGGYGIKNVNERLTMLFGEEYRLRIASKIGKGTTVTIRLPIIHNEEEWVSLYENHGH